jgi:hypothetical protein
MANVRTLKMNLLADVDDFSKGLKSADDNVNTLQTKIIDFSKKAALAFGAVVTAAAYMAVRVANEGMQMAADLAETTSKTNEVFKQNSDEIIKWSKTAGRSFGLTQQAALDSAATFALYAKSAGLSSDETVKFSKRMVALSADLASFYNTGVEEAAYAIGAAFRGESEPLRKYNILLDEGTKKAAFMRSEFKATATETMATGKILGAYTSILEQSTVAQGDFARTSDGLANQQRILNAELGVTKVAFGEMFLPLAKSVVTFINDKWLPAIQQLIYGFKGEQGLIPAIRDSKKILDGVKESDFENTYYNIGEALREVANSFGKIGEALNSKDMETGKSNLEQIADSMATIAGWLEKITTFGAKFGSVLDNIRKIDTAVQYALTGRMPQRAVGGSVSAGQPFVVGELGREVFVPDSNGKIIPHNQLGGNVTINLNGIIDAESARRSIEKLLQDSARRTGAINLVGATL